MSEKDKRREALRLGKKDMSFAEIMQAIGACRADDLTVETVAGISGHALSGQNRMDRYEHCV